MPRACFTLQVRPERIEEYAERHAAVWPEMLRALSATGWRNYSLFLRADGLLIGYVEVDDLDAAVAGMAETEVNARWQAEMSPFFVDLGDAAPDTGLLRLREVFHLEDQLALLPGPAAPPVPDPTSPDPSIGRKPPLQGARNGGLDTNRRRHPHPTEQP